MISKTISDNESNVCGLIRKIICKKNNNIYITNIHILYILKKYIYYN